MQNNIKSSAVAGVLGVFLGAFGAHDWYLGNVKKAITHVCLCVGGVMMLMVGIILMSLLRDIPALNALSICVLIAAYIIIVGNGIWGFIEGVIILAQGDAGLAAKGYRVSAPVTLNETMPAPNPNTNATPNAMVAPASGTAETAATVTTAEATETTETAGANTPSPVDTGATTLESASVVSEVPAEPTIPSAANASTTDTGTSATSVDNANTAPTTAEPTASTPASPEVANVTTTTPADVSNTANTVAETSTIDSTTANSDPNTPD